MGRYVPPDDDSELLEDLREAIADGDSVERATEKGQQAWEDK